MPRVAWFVVTGVLALVLGVGLVHTDGTTPQSVSPEPRAETDTVPNGGDAADDPAIWLHPTDPEKSLILGTDKAGGLHVYGLDGRDLQTVGDGLRPNNVDVLYEFSLDGRATDLAVATTRADRSKGVKVWAIDPETRKLTDVTAGGVIAALKGDEPYGICTYRSRKSGKGYFFANGKSGAYEQYELKDGGKSLVTAEKVRDFKVGSVAEGCVADDETGFLYVAEEGGGIWKYGAEPDAGDKRKRIAKVGDNGLTADVEGLTLYCAPEGKGYLIASSQGNNSFKVYTREGDNTFVTTIDPKPGKFGKPIDTDGIAVSNRPLGASFSKGLFVVQDGKGSRTSRGKQNFKLYGWDDVAGDKLLIDTTWSPRHR